MMFYFALTSSIYFPMPPRLEIQLQFHNAINSQFPPLALGIGTRPLAAGCWLKWQHEVTCSELT